MVFEPFIYFFFFAFPSLLLFTMAYFSISHWNTSRRYLSYRRRKKETISKIQWFNKPVVTVCQMRPNHHRVGVIRNGSLTSQTDFESKFKTSTRWFQSVPIQLI